MTATFGQEGSDRNILTDAGELLFRQVLFLNNERPSWSNFAGRRSDDWQVSTDRQKARGTPEDAFAAYTANGAPSFGTLATSVGDVGAHRILSYEAKIDGNDAHCQYDLKADKHGNVITRGGREKICVDLFERAMSHDRPHYWPTT